MLGDQRRSSTVLDTGARERGPPGRRSAAGRRPARSRSRVPEPLRPEVEGLGGPDAPADPCGSSRRPRAPAVRPGTRRTSGPSRDRPSRPRRRGGRRVGSSWLTVFLTRRRPRSPGVEVDVPLGVGGDRGDVVDAFELHPYCILPAPRGQLRCPESLVHVRVKELVAEVEGAPRAAPARRRRRRPRARRLAAAATANFGAGKNAGRWSARPSAFESSRLVTGFGAVALTVPETLSLSSAQRISPTSSSMWIQDMYCSPPAIGPPTPSLNGSRSCSSRPPCLVEHEPGAQDHHAVDDALGLAAAPPPTRPGARRRSPVAGRRLLVEDLRAPVAVVADRGLADEDAGAWRPAAGFPGAGCGRR